MANMKIEITGIKREGEQDNEQGLFVEYLNQKISEYIEPERAGTARGDKIGFPAKKYLVCLMVALTNYSLKFIDDHYGEKLGFSYGLLRKWNSESDFKAQKDQFQKEFALRIFKYIQSEFRKSWKSHKEYYDGKSDEKPFDVYRELITRDAKTYNSAILIRLEELSINHFEKIRELEKKGEINPTEHQVELLQYYNIFQLIKYASGKETRGYSSSDKKLLKSCVSESIDLLKSKRDLTVKDQRKIIGHLELMMNFLDQV